MSIYTIKDPACGIWRVMWDQYTNTLTFNVRSHALPAAERMANMMKDGHELPKITWVGGAILTKIKVVYSPADSASEKPETEFLAEDGTIIVDGGKIELMPPPEYVFETERRTDFLQQGLSVSTLKKRNAVKAEFPVKQYMRERDGSFTPILEPTAIDVFYTIHMHDNTLLTNKGLMELFDHFRIDPTSPPGNLQPPLAKSASAGARDDVEDETVTDAVSKVRERNIIQPQVDKKAPRMDNPPSGKRSR